MYNNNEIKLDLYHILETKNVKKPTGERPSEGDIIFNYICQILDSKEYSSIRIDLSSLPNFTSAFLNNAIGKLFIKYNHEDLFKILKIEGVTNSFDFKLIRETIKNAINFSINNNPV